MPLSPPVASRPGTTRSSRRAHPTLSLFVILAAQLMVVLDATIVNVALPRIQHSLGFSSTGLSWVLNAYVLTFGGLLLLGARAGDLRGRRRVFVAGITLFSASSLAGGFATSGEMLLCARALQGIGAALAAPSALALLTTLFPEGSARIRAIALFTTVSATGGAIGLVGGGMLTEWVGWRAVMFVNVPIGIAVVLLARRVLAETPTRLGRFDLAGALCSTFGVTGLVFGLVQAGSDGWTSPLTLGALSLGVVLLATFLRIERQAVEPILPLRLLTDGPRSAAIGARALVYCGMYGMFFFLTQFLQEIDGYSPLRAGVSFLPMPLAVFVASQLTSRVLVGRVAPKHLMLGGISLAALGLAVASTLNSGSGYLVVLASLLLVGGGSGLAFVSLMTAALRGVAPGDAGAASGLVNVAQQLGGALGVAVLVTVFGTATDHRSFPVEAGDHGVALLVGGLDAALRAGVLFALVAVAVVALFVRRREASATPARSDEAEEDLEALDAAV